MANKKEKIEAIEAADSAEENNASIDEQLESKKKVETAEENASIDEELEVKEKELEKKYEAAQAAFDAETKELKAEIEQLKEMLYEAVSKERQQSNAAIIEQLTGQKAKIDEETEEKYVTVNIPLTEHLTDDVFVGVNGRTFQIKRGVDVKVPLFVAEVLVNKAKMEKYSILYNIKYAPKE